jgi:hypothetical protein
VSAARFRFRRPLDDPRRLWLAWDGARYAPRALPATGQRLQVPGAALRFGL